MSQPKVKIITTEDGSHSLYHEELQETYHSSHGAFRESIHVFMLYGLDSWLARNPNKFPVRVFEVGFGTGLNAWLALVWAEQNQVPVLYHSIEPFPLEAAVYNQLNYTEHDHGIWHYHKYFQALHEHPWNEGGPVSEYFNFKKDQTTLEESDLYPADLVFYYLLCHGPTEARPERPRTRSRNPPWPPWQNGDDEGLEGYLIN